MAYWLLKTEPSVYSYADLEKEKRAVWDGVTNNLALKHIRSIRKGDLTFIYHTGEEKALVGIAEVTSDPYPDPKQKDAKVVVVDIKPLERLSRPVTLTEVKTEPSLKNFELVRMPRLSVMPVTQAVWNQLLGMGKK
jgi:predicted RNA-binding protein with PUA-like domain